MEYSLREIAETLDGTVEGDPDLKVSGVRSLEDATQDHISFLANPRYEKYLAASSAGAIIVGQEAKAPDRVLIRVRDAYRGFAQILRLFHPLRSPDPRVHPSAVVSQEARISPTARIDALVTVSAGCEVGDRTWIHPGCVMGEHSVLGDDCILFANVSVYDRVKIGSKVIVHAGTVLGSDGFGFANVEGRHEKVPQVGGVVVEDDVEIGATCTIDRGTLGDTVIGAGSKLDNQVHLAHNVKVGRDVLLIAQTGISGSTTIGDKSIFAGQSAATGHLKIGKGVVVAAKTGVIKDIPDGSALSGSLPGFDHGRWRRSVAIFRKLPQLWQRVKSIEEFLRTKGYHDQKGEP